MPVQVRPRAPSGKIKTKPKKGLVFFFAHCFFFKNAKMNGKVARTMAHEQDSGVVFRRIEEIPFR